jgi:hypothetical protein
MSSAKPERKNANAGVREFWQTVGETDVYLSVQTIGEIRRE